MHQGSGALSSTDWATLEELGSIPFGPEARTQISEALELVAEWGKHRADDVEREAADLRWRTSLADLQRSLCGFRSDLRAVEAYDIPGQNRSLLETWRAQLPADLGLPTEYHELGPLAERALEILYRTIETVSDEVRMRPPERHAKRQAIDYLIASFADIYARSGGTPSASYQVIHGRRETRFLRALRYLHGRLPTSQQLPSERALDERAHDVLSERRAERQARGLKPWSGRSRPRKG